MMFGSYSFKNINAIFGVAEIEGWDDGDDCLSVAPAQDRFTKVVGAKGDVVRSASNDKSVTITLRLLQTSASNGVLNAIKNLDDSTGTGVLPFIFTDKKAGETYVVKNAWIAQEPTITRGRNQKTHEWVLHGDVGAYLRAI